MLVSPFELLGFGLSAVLLVGYHLFLASRLRLDPHYTIQGVNRDARAAWVRYIMQDESRSILAVQTLRNSTMVATFLASTAVLMLVATLSLIGQADAVTSVWHALNLAGPSQPGLWAVKVLFLVSDFFLAFFSFAMAVRLFNHIGYQINLPANTPGPPPGEALIVTLMNRAGAYYTLGMRAYYFAVPLVFWLFSPLLMVGATIVLLGVLYANDRIPQE
jgi:uncharacterized membrane protein